MSNLVPADIITIDKDRAVTTSNTVAEVFGKKHPNVVRAIETIINNGEKDTLNFESIFYLDSMNRPRPAYNITKRGFIKLVFGFTGQKAEKFKDAFIDAFEAMEEKLRGPALANLSRLEFAQQLAVASQRLLEAEQERAELEEQNAVGCSLRMQVGNMLV